MIFVITSNGSCERRRSVFTTECSSAFLFALSTKDRILPVKMRSTRLMMFKQMRAHNISSAKQLRTSAADAPSCLHDIN